MKTQKRFRRYIPVLIKQKLDELTYNRKDDLYVIIDLVYRKEVYYKSDYQNLYGFTEISQAQFKELLPSSDGLHSALEFLINNHLLIRNDFYQIAAKSKAYKLPKEMLGKTIPVTIEDKNINSRIGKQLKKYKAMKEQRLEFAQTKYLKTFRIDMQEASKAVLDKAVCEIRRLSFNLGLSLSHSDIIDIIECRPSHTTKRARILCHPNGGELHDIMHRYVVHSTRLNAIIDGFLFFKRNETNGRLDTNLTSLPSYLRPYIISDEKLVNLDIKNSQPYFLYAMIKDNPDINTEEIQRFGELVISGTLYEAMMERYRLVKGYIRTRAQMKHMMYRIFFSKNQSYQKEKDFLGSMFPSIMAFINQTNRIQNNTLAIRLQRMESHSVLDVIMPLLQSEGMAPYTIHDSFICMESEAARIREVFVQKLSELYGIAPAMHMDYILPEIPNEEDDVWDNEAIERHNLEVESKYLDEGIQVTCEITTPRRSIEEINMIVEKLIQEKYSQMNHDTVK